MLLSHIDLNNFRQLYKELFLLFVFLCLSVFFLYFIPIPLNKYSFLLLLPLVVYSKKDYFWLAYIFLILNQPGGLFYGGEANDSFRFPLYSLTAGFSFGLEEIVLLILLFKAIKLKKDKNNVHPDYFRWLNYFFILFICLVVITPVLGADMASFRYIKKAIIYLSVSFTLLYNFSKNDFERMLAILLPFSIFALFFQLYSLANQHQFVHLIRPEILYTQGEFNTRNMDIVERPIEMTEILFINFVASLYFLKQQILPFNRSFLIFIHIISYIAIFMTATRSWFLALTLGYIFSFMIGFGSLKLNTIKAFLVTSLMLLSVLFLNPKIASQVESASIRLSTIQSVVKGDITAEGTLQRYDVRAPKVIEGIKGSSIILGAAFSTQFLEHDDFHVGFHNMFLNFGLVGIVMALFFFFSLLIKAHNLKKYIHIWGMLFVALIMLLIINSGTQTLGFNVTLPSRYILQAIIIVFLLKLISFSFLISKTKRSC